MSASALSPRQEVAAQILAAVTGPKLSSSMGPELVDLPHLAVVQEPWPSLVRACLLLADELLRQSSPATTSAPPPAAGSEDAVGQAVPSSDQDPDSGVDLGALEPKPMVTETTCSWCHESNHVWSRWCHKCGHSAHKARAECDCPRCRTTLEALRRVKG